MSTFPKLQRNISYKIYIKDLLLSFFIAYLSSSFIYFPLLIGLFISLNLRLSFILPFLFFTQITHSFVYFSLIIFYFIFKYYLYPVLYIKINKEYITYFSIPLIYLLYFSALISYYTINDINFNVNVIFIVYYILIEELLAILDKKL